MKNQTGLYQLGKALLELDRLMIEIPIKVIVTVDRPMLFNVDIHPADKTYPEPIARGRSVLLYEAIERAISQFHDGNNWDVVMPAPPKPDAGGEGQHVVGPDGTIHHF